MTYSEANLAELVSVEDETAVKDKRRLGHVVVHGLPVDLLELLPLGRDHDRLLLLARLERRVHDGDLLLDRVERHGRARLREVLPDLRLLDLRVVDSDICALREEVANEGDGRRLAGVTGVGLEGEAENGDVLEYPESAMRDWQVDVFAHTLPVMVLKRVSTTVFEKRAF